MYGLRSASLKFELPAWGDGELGRMERRNDARNAPRTKYGIIDICVYYDDLTYSSNVLITFNT